MAQFDLKKATIHIRDGYAAAGAVNNAAGYTVGATTIVIDGIVGVIQTGDTFTLGADTTIYTVISHIETLGNTTSITFTPGLAVAATDNEAVNFQPHEIEIRLVEGTLTYNEKKARTYVKNRGKLDTVRNGDEDPMEIRTDFMWEFIRSQTGNPPTIEECLKRTGGASNWISSATDKCEPYAVDIVVKYDPDCPGIDIEQVILPDFRYEELGHDAKQGTITLQGKCNAVEATAVRIAA